MKNVNNFDDFLNEAKGTNNVKAVKNLIKELENTPYGVGLALLRERLLANAEADLKTLNEDPKSFVNPIFNRGMYKDMFEKIIKHLNFDESAIVEEPQPPIETTTQDEEHKDI